MVLSVDCFALFVVRRHLLKIVSLDKYCGMVDVARFVLLLLKLATFDGGI